MVTKDVIKEIYRKYSTPPKDAGVLDLPHYIELLSNHHNLKIDEDEIINEDLEDCNPFRRLLWRRMTAVLEFDKVIAFVFNNHIIFFDKEAKAIHVHFKPEKQGFLSRIIKKIRGAV